MCNECTCQCANEPEKIKRIAKTMKNPSVLMNQATYEAITGNVLEVEGVPVTITNGLNDRQWMVEGKEV